MGDNLPLPEGTKKAKKKLLMEKLELGSVASSQAMESMAHSSAKMTEIMARRQRHDSWSKRAELCLKMGNEEKAMEMMDLMEKDDADPLVQDKSDDVPTDIALEGDENQSENDNQSETSKGLTLKEAVPNSLDTDDEIDDTSSHPSQPSNDSRND